MGSPFGYPDWQRVSSQDGATFIDEISQLRTGTYTIGPFNVSRWRSLSGRMAAIANPVFVTISWFTDQTLLHICGSQSFVLSPNVTHGMQFEIPNMGPWVSLTFDPGNPATAWRDTLTLFGSDRGGALVVIPTQPTLYHLDTFNLNAGTTNSQFMSDYFVGKAKVYFDSTAVASLALFALLDAAFTPIRIYQKAYAAATPSVDDVDIPPGAIRVDLTNTSGGASQNWVTIVPSLAP